MNSKQKIFSYGFEKLDELTGGLHPGELILIGARPGMGKSVFAYNIVSRMASEGNCAPVILVSPDRPTNSFLRFIKVCAESSFANHATDLNMDSCFTVSSLSVGYDIPKIKKMYERSDGMYHPLVIDQVQLVNYSATNRRGTAVDFGNFFDDLKQLAVELSIPIVILAKWPRKCEYRYSHGGDPRPRLSDFSATNLSQDTFDTVLFLHRDDYYSDGLFLAENGAKSSMEVIIAKSQNASTGVCNLDFDFWSDLVTD